MKNPVKEKLARGELVASMTVRLVSGIEIVAIAKSAGFDSLYIDLEHSSLTLQAASQISIMALEAEIPALVRVPANTPEYISRVLDGGALGVIAPGVRSAEEAHAVVAAARYPPAGSRGLVAGLPHFGFRSGAGAVARRPRRRPAALRVPQRRGRRGAAGAEPSDPRHGAVRVGGVARCDRGDRRHRGHRHGDDRIERPPRRPRPPGTIRPPQARAGL